MADSYMAKLEAPTSDSRFPELTRLIQDGNCIAFVGAGMSSPPYPLWPELLQRLCIACNVEPIQCLNEHKRKPTFYELARIARDNNPKIYRKTLCEIFIPHEPTHRYHLLAKLPFKYFLTTNYDSMLIESRRVHSNGPASVIADRNSMQLENRKYGEVFHLHGLINDERPDSVTNILLTNDDFEEAYNNSPLSSLLEQCITFNNLCFLGCSMNDEYLYNIFMRCKHYRDNRGGRNNPNAPHWFILVDYDEILPANIDDMGLEPVRYSKINARYDGLKSILEYWGNIYPAEYRDPWKSIYPDNEEVPR